MNRAAIEILQPGLLTTVQDLGRWGHQSIGVSVSGPMDPFAHRLANVLVMNGRDLATLEITLTGPTLRFLDARVFAVTGADFEILLDDSLVATQASVEVRPGAVLRFGDRRAGARAYLAIGGGIDVSPVLGSRATHLPTSTGGWEGRALRRGDQLPLGVHPSRPTVSSPAPRAVLPMRAANSQPRVRVLPGAHADRFTDDARGLLTTAPYMVDPASNRMGYRLTGTALAHRASADILSEPTPIGTLQVSASGQPVLLMADRQTTGGYTTIATVISADLGVAGQVPPGGAIAFAWCTHAEALAALRERERPLRELESAIQ